VPEPPPVLVIPPVPGGQAAKSSAATTARAVLASFAGESTAELAATCLAAVGGTLALVSFFMPWAAGNGIAIGTVDVDPRPGAWAFDTPAGWPLVLLFVVLAAAIVASYKLDVLLPGLASPIKRLTSVVAPMLLGGIMLGVSLMYLTLPWGCGDGPVLFGVGGGILVASSIVALFAPAGTRPA
jgi:hypothetical protein